MNARQIAEAVAVLREAARALNTGGLDIHSQISLGGRCYAAAAELAIGLEKVPVEVEP